MSNDEMIIKFNPTKKFPYEVWLDNELIDTFASEQTARDMCKLQGEVRELYIKNQYEKFVLHRDGKFKGCLHDDK